MLMNHHLSENDHLRLAVLSDLPRIATVATAGFFHSPVFQIQRPYYAEYVEDTFSSYWRQYKQGILDPASVVLVTKDRWNELERKHTYESLRKSQLYDFGMNTEDGCIVGVCSVDVCTVTERGEVFPCSGDLMVMNAPKPLARDVSVKALEYYGRATAPSKTQHLAEKLRISTLVVHPAYWRRGHARRLVGWCTSLADLHRVPIGISATPMGRIVALKAGFQEREVVQITVRDVQEDNALHVDAVVADFELWVAVRLPSEA